MTGTATEENNVAKANKSSEGSRGKVRVFFAEFEGDDTTVQEGLRAFAAAINKPAAQPTYIRARPAQNLTGPSPSDDYEATDESDATEDAHEVVDGAVAQATSRPVKQRKPPSMTLVKSLNFYPHDRQSFRDFCATKKHTTQYEQIVLAVYYMRRILDIDSIDAHHIYTCFKEMGVRVPRDLPQIIRNCASTKGWVDATRKEGIEITTIGENAVEIDLALAGADE